MTHRICHLGRLTVFSVIRKNGDKRLGVTMCRHPLYNPTRLILHIMKILDKQNGCQRLFHL